MSKFARFLLRIAGWIGGREREDWTGAMAAEAEASGDHSTAWAWGCLGAAIRDRLWRNRFSLIAIALLPAAAEALTFATFHPMAWLVRHQGLPTWTFLILYSLVFAALGLVLGRLMPLRGALIAAALCSLLFQAIGMTIFWIKFGQSPDIWFREGATIYMMPPLLGLAFGASTWMLGAWIGSRRPRPSFVD